MKKQILLTPSEGKRLIAKMICERTDVLDTAKKHTLVITGGTTNGYIAEELSKKLGFAPFDRSHFFRGIYSGKKAEGARPFYDFIIKNGELMSGLVIDDVAADLTSDDIIIKGGNAVWLPAKSAGVIVGNPQLGNMAPIYAAYYGRRVKLLCPIGVEKRVDYPLKTLANFINSPDMAGPRLAEFPGEVFSELDALAMTGVNAMILAGGGVGGYEGCVLFGLEGDEEAMEKADALIASVKGEPLF